MKVLEFLDRLATAAFEVGGNSKGWMRSIEGLRGLGAFMVFLVHYATLVRPWLPEGSLSYTVNETFFAVGNVGVDVFFAISGYLINAMLIKAERPILPYGKRRIQRIYPTFLAVMLLYCLLSLVVPDQSKIPHDGSEAARYLLANFLLLPGILDIDPMITVAWSLSYEMFFYLSMPLVLTLFNLRSLPGWARAIFWLAAWVLIYLAAPQHLRASMFIVGILVHETTQMIDRQRPAPSLTVLALTVFAGVLAFKAAVHLDAVTFTNAGKVNQLLLFVACYLLCIAVFCKEGWLSRCFALRPLRYFGNMSYAFYLIHGLALKFFFLVFNLFLPAQSHVGEHWFWLLFLPAFILACLASSVLFLLVERPYSLDGRSLLNLLWRRTRHVS